VAKQSRTDLSPTKSPRSQKKTVTTIGVVAFVIAAAITGLAGISGTAWSGYDRMILLFIGVFLGVFLLGYVLDRAAKNALGGGR
jgi:hypothetical protein